MNDYYAIVSLSFGESIVFCRFSHLIMWRPVVAGRDSSRITYEAVWIVARGGSFDVFVRRRFNTWAAGRERRGQEHTDQDVDYIAAAKFGRGIRGWQ